MHNKTIVSQKFEFLGWYHLMRYDKARVQGDLDQYVLYDEQALSCLDRNDTNYLDFHFKLGQSYDSRFLRIHTMEDLEKSTKVFQGVAAQTSADEPSY